MVMKLLLSAAIVAMLFGCASQNNRRIRSERAKQLLELKKGGFSWQDPEVVNYTPPPLPTLKMIKDAMCAGEIPKEIEFILPGGSKLEMVGIPSGSCIVGDVVPVTGNSDLKMRANGNIAHKITLSDQYWIGRYEITQKQYEVVVGKRVFPFPGHDLPASGMSWNEAKEFVKKLNECQIEGVPEGYRFDLPTEAQWEFACRALTTTEYNNGGDAALTNTIVDSFRYELIDPQNPSLGGSRVPYKRKVIRYLPESEVVDEVAWYAGNSSNVVHEVGRKKPNKWGVYDMHGNVAEWCLDCVNFPDGTNYIDPIFTDYRVGHEARMRGERMRNTHVVKGGSAGSWAGPHLASAGRQSFPADATNSFIGIRIVLVPRRLRGMEVDERDKNVYGISPLNIELKLRQQRAVLQTRAKLNSAVEKIQRNREREESIWRWVDYAVVGLQFADAALKTAVTIDEAIHRRNSIQSRDGFSGDSWGTIKGPENIVRGKTAVYELYVGGKKITSGVSWEQAGTSITVSNCGNFARVLAGEPPIKYGSFKTKIRAVYNGKTYTKNLQIKK